MAINRFITNNEVINRAAVECGLTPQTDTFSNVDPAMTQMVFLLTTAAQELMEMFPWEVLNRSFQYLTGEDEQGQIDLPADFGYMLDQTGWERSENVPLIGGLSAQEWTYLLGRDLVSSTIYASFRFNENQLWIFPNDPMPSGLDINFEYISRNLFLSGSSTPELPEYNDRAVEPNDICLFPPNLIVRYLKVKFLEAKGFDSQKSEDNFWRAFYSWTGKDNSNQVLNAGRQWLGIPYLDMYRNSPDTGFGRGAGG